MCLTAISLISHIYGLSSDMTASRHVCTRPHQHETPMQAMHASNRYMSNIFLLQCIARSLGVGLLWKLGSDWPGASINALIAGEVLGRELRNNMALPRIRPLHSTKACIGCLLQIVVQRLQYPQHGMLTAPTSHRFCATHPEHLLNAQ